MRALPIALFMGLCASAPAAGEVTARSDQGFAVQRSVVVSADAAQAWRILLRPARWWQGSHTWSGNAANLTLDGRAGGCFCERLPRRTGASASGPGTAEHMRVIHASPSRLLRMSGALGPLQGEAVHGTMTVTLLPGDAGTTIRLEYVVGGCMRLKSEQIAPLSMPCWVRNSPRSRQGWAVIVQRLRRYDDGPNFVRALTANPD